MRLRVADRPDGFEDALDMAAVFVLVLAGQQDPRGCESVTDCVHAHALLSMLGLRASTSCNRVHGNSVQRPPSRWGVEPCEIAVLVPRTLGYEHPRERWRLPRDGARRGERRDGRPRCNGTAR